jgi:TRAP-type C4-dicarboxylate transport system permease small subunit
VVKSASALLVVWFLLVVIVASFTMISFGMIVSSPALQLPMAVPYSALPVGLSYFLLEFAIAIIPEIRDPALVSTSAETAE